MQCLILRAKLKLLGTINYRRTFCRSFGILRGITTPPEATNFKDKLIYILKQDDKVLTEQLDQFTNSYPSRDDESVRNLAAHLCVPAQDLCASPFTLRVAALAAQEGIAVVHHELRKWPQLRKQEEKTIWEQGALSSPISNFHYDDMFATFNPNPNLGTKWAVYELLTRYCKFFWCPGITRWELYLGAMLNQLVPTLYWHGLEKITTGKNDKPNTNTTITNTTDNTNTTNETSQNTNNEISILSSSPSPSFSSHPRSNATHLREAVWHFFRELSKIETEMESVKCHEKSKNEILLNSPWRDLDSSADALEYVSAHYPRVYSEELATVLSSLPPSLFHFDEMPQYVEHVEKTLDKILFSDISLKIDSKDEDVSKKFNQRLCTDLLIREANFMLSGEPPKDNTQIIQEFSKTVGLASKGMLTAMTLFQKKLKPEVFAVGIGQFPLLNTEGSFKIEWNSVNQLQEGLTISFPATVQLLQNEKYKPQKEGTFKSLVAQFARSPVMFQPTSLSSRFSSFLKENYGSTQQLVFDMLHFEGSLLSATESDEQVAKLGAPFDDEFVDLDKETIYSTIVRPSSAFTLVTTNYDVYKLHETLTSSPSSSPSSSSPSPSPLSPLPTQNKQTTQNKNIKQPIPQQQKLQQKPINAPHCPSAYLVGFYEEQVVVLNLPTEWVPIWEWLSKNRNSRLTVADLDNQISKIENIEKREEELFGYLEEFSENGAIGLFPDA